MRDMFFRAFTCLWTLPLWEFGQTEKRKAPELSLSAATSTAWILKRGLTGAKQHKYRSYSEPGIGETEIERRAQANCKAPLTAVASIDDAVVAGFGDGSLTFFRPSLAPVSKNIHKGVILCMTEYKNGFISGGDDGRFLAITTNGDTTEIADFGTKWVDCVAASDEIVACSSGSDVHLFEHEKSQRKIFQHQSTVGGLAFDKQGQRLAVSHYEGVTIWERSKRRWKSTRLFWKGSHGNVTFSPDGKYIVHHAGEFCSWLAFARQGQFAMSGYPEGQEP